MRALARSGIVAGETGAAGLGGLLELLTGAGSDQHREELHVNETTRVLLFITDGATDPQAYANIIGCELTRKRRLSACQNRAVEEIDGTNCPVGGN